MTPVFTFTLVTPALAALFGAAGVRRAVDIEALPEGPVDDWSPILGRLDEFTVDPGGRELAAVRGFAERVGYRAIADLAVAIGARLDAAQYPSFDDAVLAPRRMPDRPKDDSDLVLLARALGDVAALRGEAVRLVQDFDSELRRAADVFDRPGSALDASAHAFVNTYGPATRLDQVLGGAWTRRANSLLERAAVEMLELATTKPRVRTCKRCGRIFVPRRREGRCLGHLWTWPQGTMIAWCRRDFQPKRSRRTDHDRERDRTYQELRRMKKRRDGLTGEAATAMDRRIEKLQEERQATLWPRGPARAERAPVIPESDSTRKES